MIFDRVYAFINIPYIFEDIHIQVHEILEEICENIVF